MEDGGFAGTLFDLHGDPSILPMFGVRHIRISFKLWARYPGLFKMYGNRLTIVVLERGSPLY
jgi:hypothetical protein